MFNPSKRNRNIGTSKQGYGQNNRNVISDSWNDLRIFWEKLEEYTVVKRIINSKEYTFLIEKTRKNSVHPCTVDDVAKIIELLNPYDLEDLHLIIFRQPKRREETLKPVWGRLNYFVEIDKHEGAAITLESFDFDRTIKWSKSLKNEDRKEFERLLQDGHKMTESKRDFTIHPTISGLRNTMLYRTFIHEVGHYVEYLEKIERPSRKNPDYDFWADYDKIPSREKENFAHSYAKKTTDELMENGLIPFSRILDQKSMESEKLDITDFLAPEK
ncbi:hypothetical protein [uncultured Croceitalea sp.]|uniref:hypothetical protein n=1 Tax=uncultured Croceitalea sp. TaxID=1798908 RepID=UPI0033067897